jgi:uncharacterized repeat protein (TIGR03803 family)
MSRFGTLARRFFTSARSAYGLGQQQHTNKTGLLKMVCIAVAFCSAAAIAARAQTVTTLADFDGANGAYSYSSLVQGFDGNFYGTAEGGGAYGNGTYYSGGTVFKVTQQGKLTAIYSFCAKANCIDGESPTAGLVLTAGGYFYGTTTLGGAHGGGTVFKLSAAGELTTLYSFCSLANCADGSAPAGLIQATDSNFYGTTGSTLFKITPAGALTTLYTFDSTPGPNAALVQGTDGNFYGTTGITPSFQEFNNASGTVFRITPEGKLTTLQSFAYGPAAGLIQGTDGNLYGTTFYGPSLNTADPNCDSGGGYGCGMFFQMSLDGSLNLITGFNGYDPADDDYDGENPAATLVQATNGKFYGTTMYGGTGSCEPGVTNWTGCGTIFGFAVEPNGTGLNEILLYPFCSQSVCPNILGTTPGNALFGALLQATNGNFYGTTSFGGAGTTMGGGPDRGFIYSMSIGLSPFVSLFSNFGHVGQGVQILGQGFKGATAVFFNGIPATFTAKSDTYLLATVPVGATNGAVTVTEPGGTLSSNKTFLVTPNVESFTPASGPVGTPVVITGNNFTGATIVTFDAKWQASFTVNSDTQITAIVPPKATVGTITVRTPNGTGTSTQTFTVTP